MGWFEATIDSLEKLIRVASDAEFRTVEGLSNFVLIASVTGAYIVRAPLMRLWNLLMWALDKKFGSAPEPPQTVPRLPPLLLMVPCVVGVYLMCVVTIIRVGQ